ncbi:MAG: threonine synthase [Acidobacteriota bacterium]
MRVACTRCDAATGPRQLGLCPCCGGILRAVYDSDALAALTPIEAGVGIDRYRLLMPVSTPIPGLGEGATPLLPSRRVGPSLGLGNLYFKNEGRNPTGSFKDRAASLSVALARESEAVGVLTASSGNSASALSAYAAASGLPCLILLEPNNPAGKLRQALATGARVLPVENLFGHGPHKVGALLRETAERLGYYLAFVWAPVNPLILEGIKTLSYEAVEAFGEAPDAVVAPVGGGDMLAAQWRGYQECLAAGAAERTPRMIGVQSESAPPLLQAFRSGEKVVAPLGYARSRISGINVPFSGDHALEAVRESEGCVAGVSDEEILAMQRRLAVEEGLWVEPASAAPVAALPGLLEEGRIHSAERIVCILSGAGFKDSHLAEAEAARVSQNPRLPFEADAIVRCARQGSAP